MGVEVTSAVGVSAVVPVATDGSRSGVASAIEANRKGGVLGSCATGIAEPFGAGAIGETVVISAAPTGVAFAGLSDSLGIAGTMAITDCGNDLRDFRPVFAGADVAALCTSLAGATGFAGDTGAGARMTGTGVEAAS